MIISYLIKHAQFTKYTTCITPGTGFPFPFNQHNSENSLKHIKMLFIIFPWTYM